MLEFQRTEQREGNVTTSAFLSKVGQPKNGINEESSHDLLPVQDSITNYSQTDCYSTKQHTMAKAGSSSEADSPSYMETHDLVYAKDSKRSKVKTHREVETVLNIHFWKPATASPVNGWMDYCYQPPHSKEEIRPVASLPAPSLPTVDEIDQTPRIPPPSPDDWKLAFFHASLECAQQFAARVNEVTGEEVLVVQEKPYYWIRKVGEELEAKQERKVSL